MPGIFRIKVIPSLVTRVVPNGVWVRTYYPELKEKFLKALKEAGAIDGRRAERALDRADD